jgi:hypothetical protein
VRVEGKRHDPVLPEEISQCSPSADLQHSLQTRPHLPLPPFAVWGARGFKAANAKSLFIPWAIIAVRLIIAGE